MAKSNQKAKSVKAMEINIVSGFSELITLLDEMADRVEVTMPLASKSLRLTIAIIKAYKEAFYATKGKRA